MQRLDSRFGSYPEISIGIKGEPIVFVFAVAVGIQTDTEVEACGIVEWGSVKSDHSAEVEIFIGIPEITVGGCHMPFETRFKIAEIDQHQHIIGKSIIKAQSQSRMKRKCSRSVILRWIIPPGARHTKSPKNRKTSFDTGFVPFGGYCKNVQHDEPQSPCASILKTAVPCFDCRCLTAVEPGKLEF